MKKLTVWNLEYMLKNYIEKKIIDINIIKGMQLRIDEENYIVNEDIDLLKKVLLVSYRRSLEKKFNHAFEIKQALIDLNGYGTKQVTRDMQVFLRYIESGYPKNIHPEISIEPKTKMYLNCLVATILEEE